jgi:hypothetical protein
VYDQFLKIEITFQISKSLQSKEITKEFFLKVSFFFLFWMPKKTGHFPNEILKNISLCYLLAKGAALQCSSSGKSVARGLISNYNYCYGQSHCI